MLPGIVAGVGGYGNCLGLPNIGGEAVFDASPTSATRSSTRCASACCATRTSTSPRRRGVGNQVVLYGARTGGDGIGGVSVLASETFAADGPAKRPSVQVGDPFMEKLLIECTLELFAAGIVTGIQDLGGAGLSCATSELASAGDGGMHVELDRVPLRDSSLAPEEILMSESQERMMAVVEPEDVDRLLAICAQVGRRGRRDRRGHRHRPAADRLARRAGRRRTAAFRRARRADVPPPLRAARLAGRPAGRRRRGAAPPVDRRRAARDPAAAGRLARTSATSRGSPTSTTATSAATRCSPSPATAG